MSLDEKALKSPKYLVYSDDMALMVSHPEPVAKYHFVTTSIEQSPDLCKISRATKRILNHMRHVTDITLKRILPNTVKIRTGFLATDISGCNLQMHSISTDLSGPFMDEDNWIMFTTDLFIPVQDVIDSIESSGHFYPPSHHRIEALLNDDTKCLECDLKFSEYKDLKQHIQQHEDDAKNERELKLRSILNNKKL